MSDVSILRCKDYERERVGAAVSQSIELLGGIEKFVRRDSTVLVKPNLLMAKGPEAGITTHPEMVRAVIRELKKIHCRIIVGDGPSVWGKYIENVEMVYEVTGIREMCKQEAVELVTFESRRWHGAFPMTTWLDTCNHVVSVPKFKTHDLTLLSGAIKNLFGLVSGTFKTELHKTYFKKEEFAKILVDIFEIVKPSLTVVDGILALEGEGPATGGKTRDLGLVLASKDCVALDAVLALVMGIEPEDVLSTGIAAKRQLGDAAGQDIMVLGESLQSVIGRPFVLPTTSGIKKNLPPFVVNLARQLIKYYPQVDRGRCTRCAACVDACPMKVIALQEDNITINYRGCIACFCCQEACPSSAISIRKSLFAKMIGL
jgi:uncharacterized protein (DUF362 family)/Pyruvate/2-oxoacid:ferredoxin oxidoreductase delta subunit